MRTDHRSPSPLLIAVCAWLMSVIAAAPSTAATINVPGDQPTIQAGVNAAGAGDVVLVAPGIYPEMVTITGRTNVTLRGSGPATTAIQAPGTGPAVRVTNSSGIQITGFRLSSDVILGDDFDIGAIRILDSSNIRIFRNLIARHSGNGIVLYGSSIEAFNNVIAQVGDDGIRLEEINSTAPNSALIYNNTIADNRGGSGVGIWLRREIDTATAFNNILFNNDYNIGLQSTSIFPHDYNLVSTPATNFFGPVSRNANEPDCDPAFVNTALLDYHIPIGSCAQDAGTASFLGNPAPAGDYDGQGRPAGGFEIGADEIRVTLVCEPKTQGFWHRQCMGAGEIAPGNGHGPGPHPSFESDALGKLFEIVDALLAFSGQSTCEALDADPARDPCERALKQYAALLLNVAAQYLSLDCKVDFSRSPDVAKLVDPSSLPGTVGGVVALVRDLLLIGTDDHCKVAAALSAAVNEGTALPFAGVLQYATLAPAMVERLAGTSVAPLPTTTLASTQSPAPAEAIGASGRGRASADAGARDALPAAVRLAVAPNPGHVQEVTFALPRAAEVELAVFDVTGRKLAALASGTFEAGVHARHWDGAAPNGAVAGPGLYFYRLRVEGETHTVTAVRVR